MTSSASATGFTLTVSAQGSGTVTKDPTNSTYPPGVNVIVTATPNAGWYFENWSGDATGTINPLNVTMNANLVITGNFLPYPTYTLTLATNGQGTIALNPGGGSYLSNSVVMATATPAAGWLFTSWSGDTNGSVNPLSLTLNTNFSLTGTFVQLPAFDLQPVSVTNVVNSTVTFSAHAVGNGPLGYQWFFSGGSKNGETNTTLTLTNVSAGQSGNYWIVATNNYGSATSYVASLTFTNAGGPTNVVHSPDEASLRAAIKLGGWVSLAFNGTITLANTINITNNVILDAQNVSATISGGSAVRLFYVAPGRQFSATNLILANGSYIVSSSPGTPAEAGAIYNDGGTVSLVACKLTNNTAQSTISGGLARGGAVFNNGGSVSLFQSSISNNASIGGGPNGNYSPFSTGTALGGALYNTNGSVTMQGCYVSSNFCEGICNSFPGDIGLARGGAAFQASGSLMISNCFFSLNQALCSVEASGSTPSPAYGGALAADGGSITIDRSQFEWNTAKGGDAAFHGAGGPSFGGAIYCASVLAVGNTTFSGNQALSGNGGYNYGVSSFHATDGSGGAICNFGTAILNRCSVYSNVAQGGSAVASQYTSAIGGKGLGGGIFNASQLTATNCTFALNFADGGNGQSGSSTATGAGGNAMGGGVFNNSNATFTAMNLTIASNSCSSPSGSSGSPSGLVYFTNGIAAGSQIANTNGTLRLHNSLVAYGGTNGNAYGIITDDGYNISSDGTAHLFSGSSYNFTDPKLGPLADYGGPTLCMALQSTSPAIDFGDSSGVPNTDQRGFVRPFGDGPDMGAFEYGSYLLLSPYLYIAPAADNVLLSFMTSGTNTYRLQASTNLSTWTDLNTNGPFASPTNINQTVSRQGFDRRYFRLLVQ